MKSNERGGAKQTEFTSRMLSSARPLARASSRLPICCFIFGYMNFNSVAILYVRQNQRQLEIGIDVQKNGGVN